MLWAITSYFNPFRWRRRLDNYRVFRRELKVPLVTVEWSPNSRFQLRPDDADVLLQVYGGDLMWQKERLLNLALGAVPATASGIAWVDCDIVFEDSDWPERTIDALQRSVFVQLYSERHDLPEGGSPETIRRWKAPAVAQSAMARLRCGNVREEDYALPGALHRGTAFGLAWAATPALLSECGFYDVCISGSGDKAMAGAAAGKMEEVRSSLRMSGRRYLHYAKWARRFEEAVSGQTGCLGGRVFHLWHGDLAKRGYVEREDLLLNLGFDPETDIALDAQGCWRWSSKKPDLHASIAAYLSERNEGGEPKGQNRSPRHGKESLQPGDAYFQRLPVK